MSFNDSLGVLFERNLPEPLSGFPSQAATLHQATGKDKGQYGCNATRRPAEYAYPWLGEGGLERLFAALHHWPYLVTLRIAGQSCRSTLPGRVVALSESERAKFPIRPGQS